MTKNQKLDEATREAIRADVRMAKQHGETKKQVAARHNIHPTMISKIMRNAEKPVKAKSKQARRKVAKKNTGSKNGTNILDMPALWNDNTSKRDAANEAKQKFLDAVEQLR